MHSQHGMDPLSLVLVLRCHILLPDEAQNMAVVVQRGGIFMDNTFTIVH